MKIAHIVCTYPPYRGGIGQVAFEYVERLRARGHDAHAFALSHGRAPADDPPYMHRLPALRFGNGGIAPTLVRDLASFDLIHLHYPFFGAAEFVAWNRLRHPSQPLVVTYHMDAQADDYRRFIFGAYRRTLFPLVMRAADRIFVSSKDYWTHSELAEVKGVDARVRELPFGVDTERFRPGEEQERRLSYGVNWETPLLLFVGGLDAAHHFKGLSVLFEALRPLVGLPWHLLVVGEGALRATYEAQARNFGFQSRVTFVGSVSSDELPYFYRAADLHLFPSVGRAEAFGLVLLEAAASGVPSIASDLPGVRTLVSHEQTGLLVAPRDAGALSRGIERLLNNPEERRLMGERARVRAVERYSWNALIDRLLTEYESLSISS